MPVRRDTDLHKAAKDGDEEGIKELLGSVNIDEQGAQGRTALHRALGGAYLECVRILLDNGAKMTIVDDMGRTSLHYAVLAPTEDGAKQCLELLFQQDGDGAMAELNLVNKQSRSGLTPLNCACSDGRVEIARILFENGADPNIVDGDGKSSIQHAKDQKMPKDLFTSKSGRNSISGSGDSGKKSMFGFGRRSSTKGGAKEVSL